MARAELCFPTVSGGGSQQGELLPGLCHPRAYLPPPTALFFEADSNPAVASADQLALGQVFLPETLHGLSCEMERGNNHSTCGWW